MGAPDWIRPEDKKLLERSDKIDDKMGMLLPALYAIAWSILIAIYFGGASS